MTFTPLKNHVLCRLIASAKEVGGIVLPDNAHIREHGPLDQFEVVAVGSGVGVSVGQTVLSREREGRPITHQGEKYILFKEQYLQAVV